MAVAIIVIVVVVLLAVAAGILLRRRRALQQRFGPEYDRLAAEVARLAQLPWCKNQACRRPQ